MKFTTVLSIVAFLVLAGTGHAQVTMVRPAPGGGYNVFNPPSEGGGITMIRPAPGGGYNQFNPPGQGGGITMIRPAPGGGFNVFASPPPPQFGYPGFRNNMGY
jgi:hypothetical protein